MHRNAVAEIGNLRHSESAVKVETDERNAKEYRRLE